MKVFDRPYTHIKFFDFLRTNEYEALVNCLDNLEWELYDRGSYHYKVSSIDYETQCYLQNKAIIEKFISTEFISTLSNSLEIQLERCKDFTFHKMDIGDFSSRHTDKNNFGELARVVYYLSAPNTYEGGSLNLYNENGTDIFEELKMPSNSFLSFRLTDDFFHEVKAITKGNRYCISITYS